MIDFKEILNSYCTANALKTGDLALDCIDDKIVKQCYDLFFQFTAKTGYEKYISPSYLRIQIDKFAKQACKTFKDELEDMYDNDEYDRFEAKWKGNVFEMIVLYMIQYFGASRFMMHTELESWLANDSEDNGADGYFSCGNKLIGINVKYRFIKELNDNDKIAKTPERTLERMCNLLQNGKITDKEFLDWGKMNVKTVCFTTTKPAWYMVKNEPIIEWIDEYKIFDYLSYKHTGNEKFWQELSSIL